MESRPRPLDLGGHAVADEAVRELEETERGREDEQDVGDNADDLRDELAGVAEQQAAHRAGDAVPARRRSVPSANRPSASAPQAPHTPCTAIAPTGSSMRKRISIHDTAQTTSRPATSADQHGGRAG